MPGGRPMKYKSVEELEEDQQSIFTKESDMCDELEENLQQFMMDLFSEEYVDHKREADFRDNGIGFIGKTQKIFKRGSRVDFIVQTKSGTDYIIEVKNYKKIKGVNLSSALGQLMGYGTLHRRISKAKSKLVLVTSDISELVCGTIKEYKLDIDIALLRKEGTYLMEK